MEMFLASSGKTTKLLVCWAPSTKEVTVSGVDGDVRILTQEGSLSKSWNSQRLFKITTGTWKGLTNQTNWLDHTVCYEKWKSIGKYYFFTWLMLALSMHLYCGKNIKVNTQKELTCNDQRDMTNWHSGKPLYDSWSVLKKLTQFLSGGSNPSYQKIPGMEPLTSQLLTAIMVDVKCVRHLESNLTPMWNVRHVMLFYVSTTTETAFMCIIP